jgi:hypothetical protein
VRPSLLAALLCAGLLVLAAVVGARDGPAAGPAERTGAPAGLAFRDTAADRGLGFRHGAFRYAAGSDPVAMTGGGVCWLDYDGDGRLDLFVVNGYAEAERDEWLDAGGLPTSRLFRNEGARFVDVTARTGAGLAVRGQGCVAADLDRDGRTDLFVTTAEYPALLVNRGDGTFAERAGATGLEVFGWHTGAAAGDVNGDGWLDLLVAGYVDLNRPLSAATLGFPNTHAGRRDLLFLSNGRSDGRVTFREVGSEAGLEAAEFAYGLGVLLSDLDRDGDLDAYVANDTNPNRLYENVPWPGGAPADPAGLGFRFEERGADARVADTGSGMGIAAADDDGDGRDDLFVTNAGRQTHAVFRSRPSDARDPSFVDVRERLGVPLSGATGWGVSWADFDLDADLDVLLANGRVPVTDLAADAEPLRLLRGEATRYADEPLEAAGPLNARGSAAADFDSDGDLDVAVNSVGGPLVLLENTGRDGNWLAVAPAPATPGAQVTVVLPGGRTLRRELRAGSSYLSSEDPRAHFGLGRADRVERVVVRWPGGAEARLGRVDANRTVRMEPSG